MGINVRNDRTPSARHGPGNSCTNQHNSDITGAISIMLGFLTYAKFASIWRCVLSDVASYASWSLDFHEFSEIIPIQVALDLHGFELMSNL